MKKMITILLASALVLGLLVTGTLAAGHFGHGTGICQNSETCYQDADGAGSVTTTAATAPMRIPTATVCATIWAKTAGRATTAVATTGEAAGINEVKG